MTFNVQTLLKEGIKFLKKGNLGEAKKVFLDALAIEPNNYDALLNLGLTYAHGGLHEDAKQILLQASAINLNEAEPHYNLGIIYSLEKNTLGAIDAYQKAIDINPKHLEASTNLSDLFNQLGRHQEALVAANQAVKLNSPYLETWLNQGKAFSGLQNSLNALKAYKRVLEIQPFHAEGLFCQAHTLDELGDYEGALSKYDTYLNHHSKNSSVLTNKGSTLNKLMRYHEALEVLEESIKLDSSVFMSWLNAGTALHNLKYFDKALSYYDQALNLQPDNSQIWSNKGNTMSEMLRYEEALISYDRALTISPNYAPALRNKGSTLILMTRYEDALATFKELIGIYPDTHDILAQIMHIKMRLCNWSDYEIYYQNLYKACILKNDTCSPFISLSVFNEGEIQKIIAENWVDKVSSAPPPVHIDNITKTNERIRIGYYSPDFKNHPVSFLIAELIELHDRKRFEVIAFSFGTDNLNPMQHRLSSAFDQFINVHGKSEMQIASLSREMGIDIAIDLCGHTHENRFGIFCHRAAPFQVSYLGHPGTMGAACIDYIIADPILIPIEKSVHYTEKLVHLPHSFQINDRKRSISNLELNKADFGLPESGVIYCCFNNNFKITPEIFHSWMQILRGVDNSVLWLLEDTPSVPINLRKEAMKAGIDPARVLFSGRIAPELYLARYRLADLFLDTYPFNGGATASDALWAGLPIITKLGDAYAGRMAASLLNAIGLPELVTNTDEEYIELAQCFGRDPSKLTSIKTKLAHNKLSTPLFNTPLNVKYIEEAFEKMMERHLSNQTPDHIQIYP
jgi:predicted O-linked N-acetylglucosamine transferase (SPINDLY family)